jgi:hypothetical protein
MSVRILISCSDLKIVLCRISSEPYFGHVCYKHYSQGCLLKIQNLYYTYISYLREVDFCIHSAGSIHEADFVYVMLETYVKLTFVSRMLEVYTRVSFVYIMMEIYLKLTVVYIMLEIYIRLSFVHIILEMCVNVTFVYTVLVILFLVTRDLSWCLSLYRARKTQIVHIVHSTLRERESSWVVNMESGCCLNRSSPSSGSGMNTRECICGVSMVEF